MKYQLIMPHYNGDIVELIARDEKGHKTIIDAPKVFSHFFIKADQIIKPDKNIVHVDKEEDYVGIEEEKLWKVETKQPSDVSRLRGWYKDHWEADIPFVRRVMIDLGITCAFDERIRPVADFTLNPSILVVDIETLSLTSKSWKIDLKNGNLAVAMIALKYITHTGEETNCQLILDKNIREPYKIWTKTIHGEDILKVYFTEEQDLLEYFWILVKKFWPDIITGWNVKFDTTYPLVRSWKLGNKYTSLRSYVGIRDDWISEYKPNQTNDELADYFYHKSLKVLKFDLMRSYAELYKPQSKKLKMVAKAESISDREHETGGLFHKLYRQNLEEAARYNWDDVWETWEINRKHDIIGFYWENKNFAGMESMELSVKAGNLLDTILLRLAKDKVCLPSRKKRRLKGQKKEVKYEGATVFDPVKGVFYNVATLDATRYYPSIILAHPHLFYPIVIDLVKWVSKGRDVVEEKLNKLTPGTPEHKSIKKRRDSRKFLLNAVYGTLGDEDFRIFKVIMASKTTALCRAGIEGVDEMCKALGMLVVRGDTDSVLSVLELGEENKNTEELVKKGEKFIVTINKFLHKYFKTPLSHLIEFKLEAIWQPLISTDKKKMYFGRVVWEDGKVVDRVIVKGLKTKRRDTSVVTNKIMEQVYHLALYDNVNKVAPYVQQEVLNFKTNPSEDLMLGIGVSKALHLYKVDALHKRGSEYANKYIYKDDVIKAGSRVYVMYCNVVKTSVEYPNTDVIAVEDPDDIPEGIFEIDYQKMLVRCVKKPLESVFDAIGITWEDLTPRENVKKLFRKKRKKVRKIEKSIKQNQ